MARVIEPVLNRYLWVMREGYRAPVEVLALTRIMYCTYVLFWGVVPLRFLSGLPNAFFKPPTGPAQLAGGFPNETLALVLDVGGILLLVAVAVGWRTRATSSALFAWAIVASAALFSLGKIDHSFITWLMVPLLGHAGWGDAFSVDAWRRKAEAPKRPEWPIPALAFAIAFGFLTAALPKLGRGWLDPSSQAAEGYFREFAVTQGRTNLLAGPLQSVESTAFWELLDWWTVGFELTIAFVVLWPRIFRSSLLVATVFHVSVVLIMNISFVAMMHVYLPLLAATALPRWLDRERPESGRRVALVALLPILFAGLALAGTSARAVLVELFDVHELSIATVLSVFVMAVAFSISIDLRAGATRVWSRSPGEVAELRPVQASNQQVGFEGEVA